MANSPPRSICRTPSGLRAPAANNLEYCDNGVENIIDDYTALLAATELYRATQKDIYLEAARLRAENLERRTDDAKAGS